MNRVITLTCFLISFCLPLPKRSMTPHGIVDEDIPYSFGHRNALDLYVPDTSGFPVILFIHGGSFVEGDRKEYPYAQIGKAFQQLNIGCAVMSYRLMRDSLWPAQPRDIAKAVKWLKENISSYGGNPSRIFVVGHSAGGHLAALVSTDSTYLSEAGASLKDIAGTVAMGAMMSDGGSVDKLSREEETRLFKNDWFFKIFSTRKNFEQSLPIRHVNTSMPPMLLILADGERYDPPKEQSVKEFISEAKSVGVPVTYSVLPHRTHMGTVEGMILPDDPAVQMIVNFVIAL